MIVTKPMSTEAKEKLEKFNEEQADWYSQCPRCKVALKGTLAKLKEHKCGPEA